jgi:outer membrane protein TolC
MQSGLAWVEACFARELIDGRQESLTRARQIEALVRASVDAGKASPSELALAVLAAGRAQALLVEAQGVRFSADSRLRWWLGVEAHQELEIVGTLDDRATPVLDRPRLDPSVNASSVQPDLLAAQAEASRADRFADLLMAQGRPFLSLGPSVTREGSGDVIVQARVAVPLPTVNAAGFEAAQAKYEAEVARARASELASRLQLELLLATEEHEHAQQVLRAIQRDVLAPAREALRLAVVRYEVGALELPIVLQTERELLEALERKASAAADVRRAELRWMRLLPPNPVSSRSTP